MKNYKVTCRVLSRRCLILSATILFVLAGSAAIAQNPPQKATKQAALDSFSKQKYETALVQFSELSSQFPKDPLYKYYCGVCLVKTEQDPSRASTLLLEAMKGSAAVRSVPNDGLFYLGRSRQMAGMFRDAIKAYNQFSELAGKKAAKELGVPDYIKQCEEGKGKLAVENTGVINEKKNDRAASEMQDKKAGLKVVAPVVAVNEDLPASYDKLLSDALMYQGKADSLGTLAAGYRSEMANAEPSARAALRDSVALLEKTEASYRDMADKSLAKAREINPLPVAAVSVKTGSDTLVPAGYHVKDTINKSVILAERPAGDSVKTDKPVLKAGAVAEVSKNDVKKDTLNVLPEAAIAVAAAEKPQEVFADFNVVAKPVYKPDEKVAVNPAVPPGLIYRIQVAVFRNQVAPSYFKGITPVNGFRNEATGLTIYYAGMFRKSADAGKALLKVKSLGFKDAFVAPLMDKKAVSADRAAILEKEWGSKPLYLKKVTSPGISADTVPPTLVFRVEVKKSPKPLPADQVENMRKMAGTRGFEIVTNESKQSIYLIGKFLSFKSASEYADLLIRNGFRESKVVAYMGKKEIPVETAKQLFEEYQDEEGKIARQTVEEKEQ